jgi:hypothetical protein
MADHSWALELAKEIVGDWHEGAKAKIVAQALIERLTPVQVQHATLPCTPSALLPGGWLCGSCREPIRREYQFCPNCGVPLKWG